MFSRSIRKTIRPHLHPTEQLLTAVLAQNAGANAAMMASALRGPLAAARAHETAHRAHSHADAAARSAALAVDRRMVIALTSQRLLILKAGGAFTVKAKELLGEAPIAAIDGIDVERDGQLTKSVTLRVGGIAIGIETARGQPAEQLPRALEHARARVSGSGAFVAPRP